MQTREYSDFLPLREVFCLFPLFVSFFFCFAATKSKCAPITVCRVPWENGKKVCGLCRSAYYATSVCWRTQYSGAQHWPGNAINLAAEYSMRKSKKMQCDRRINIEMRGNTRNIRQERYRRQRGPDFLWLFSHDGAFERGTRAKPIRNDFQLHTFSVPFISVHSPADVSSLFSVCIVATQIRDT